MVALILKSLLLSLISFGLGCGIPSSHMWRDANTGQIVDCRSRAQGERNIFIAAELVGGCSQAMRSAGATQLDF